MLVSADIILLVSADIVLMVEVVSLDTVVESVLVVLSVEELSLHAAKTVAILKTINNFFISLSLFIKYIFVLIPVFSKSNLTF